MTWLLLRLYRRPVIVWLLLALGAGCLVLASWQALSAPVASPAVQQCLARIHANLVQTPAAPSTPPPKGSAQAGPTPPTYVAPTAVCSQQELDVLDAFGTLSHWIAIGLSALPLLLGVFIAAPLIGRELEEGTHRLLWTQSVTPMHWLFQRVTASLGFAVLLLGIVILTAIPWLSLGGHVFSSRWPTFDSTPLMMVAYGFFAVSLGLAAAAVSGRTVVSMAVTAVLWVGIRGVFEVLLRPQLLPPMVDRGMTSASAGANWFLRVVYVDSSGHVLTNAAVMARLGLGTISDPASLAAHGISMAGLYQPAERFWTFQVIEATFFFGLAALCILIGTAWVKFRLSRR